jgi:hypothetical protein
LAIGQVRLAPTMLIEQMNKIDVQAKGDRLCISGRATHFGFFGY